MKTEKGLDSSKEFAIALAVAVLCGLMAVLGAFNSDPAIVIVFGVLAVFAALITIALVGEVLFNPSKNS
jgi:uncharacterized membrane protein